MAMVMHGGALQIFSDMKYSNSNRSKYDWNLWWNVLDLKKLQSLPETMPVEKDPSGGTSKKVLGLRELWVHRRQPTRPRASPPRVPLPRFENLLADSKWQY